jgi:CheY-like chemotaxis protein
MMIADPIVLVVDDSENDALLMRTVFERAGFVEPLRVARDGEEAITYLRGDGVYGDRKQFPLPTVMLLDLNMPRKNGFEVLEWIRQQPALKRLRVYILSASSRAEDIQRAYDLGANSYLVKPGNLDGLMHLAKCLVAWLKLSHFTPLTEASEDHDRPPMRWFAMADEDSTQPGHTSYH